MGKRRGKRISVERPGGTPLPSGWEFLSDDGQLRCAFSSGGKVGMGPVDDSGGQGARVFWYVEQTGEERFEGRRINSDNLPTGEAEVISITRLINDFTPEIAYYEDKVLPAIFILEETLERGDAHRLEGRLYSAEMEYDSALQVDERNVRALFGLGLIFVGRKELNRTRGLLEELVDIKAAFLGKNQHLFNEFGIALRKVGMLDEALAYYGRALEFVDDDENLYYNLARSHYENDDWEACIDALLKSHTINPELAVARDMFKLIVALSEDEGRLARYRKPPVPSVVAERARRALSLQSPATPLDESPLNEPGTDIPVPDTPRLDEPREHEERGRARYGGRGVVRKEEGESPSINLDALDKGKTGHRSKKSE